LATCIPERSRTGSYFFGKAIILASRFSGRHFFVKISVLTGAGISRESGLKTFRDSDGLWEGHRVEDVATPEAWRRDPKLVLDFYNQRRRDVREAKPNAGHFALAELETKHKVT